jgi:hypothetical protein
MILYYCNTHLLNETIEFNGTNPIILHSLISIGVNFVGLFLSAAAQTNGTLSRLYSAIKWGSNGQVHPLVSFVTTTHAQAS